LSTALIQVQRAGYVVVQDLGRTGLAAIGISANGAGDQSSARLANTLVGNGDGAALIEIIASELVLKVDSDLLIAITGAAKSVELDSISYNTHETLVVLAGSTVFIPAPKSGQRTYLAINGQIQAPAILGSVGPDSFLDFGQRLVSGMTLEIETQFNTELMGSDFSLFRFNVPVSNYPNDISLLASVGPDADRLKAGVAGLAGAFTVLPQSDHVGMRLSGVDLELVVAGEILSRGVPIGAIEVTPSGELIILLRGRLLTAGYPVVAVLTRSAIDQASQATPGTRISLVMVDMESAKRELIDKEIALQKISQRVAQAFETRGWGQLLAPDHSSFNNAITKYPVVSEN
jgi:biotin-dependent carboxylase-like uncharacterized protein